MGLARFPTGAAPNPPPAGYVALYAKPDNTLYLKTSTGAEIAVMSSIAGDTGFPVDSDGEYLTTLAYDESTRTVTLAPTDSTFDVYVQGVKYTFTGAQEIVHSTDQGGHFIYVDATGTIVDSLTPWDLLLHAPIAFVFWDNTNARGLIFEERHHAGRDVFWHRNQHAAEGTKVTSGFAISGYTLSDGSADSAVTYAIASGRVEDEDIRVDTQSLPDDGPYVILERVGATDWRITRSNTVPFFHSSNQLQYNQNNGGSWQRTGVPEDNFVNYWVFAVTALPTGAWTPTPSATQQIVIVPGQAVYASEAAAHAETPANIVWGAIPFQEIAPLYQITMRYNASAPGAYTNTARCAITRVLRVVGTFASVAQAAAADHGTLLGLLDDDHLLYALTNPQAAAVTYNASGTTTITLDGRTETFYATASGGATTWAFAGAAATGSTSAFTLELTNGGSQTQTWPAAVDWDAGAAPTLTAAGVDVLTFYTRDGGTTWFGFLAAADIK